VTWIQDYQLVRSLDEAEELMAQPGWALMGGGSHLVALKPPGIDKLIDLLPLGLDFLREQEGMLQLGARLRLQDIAEREDHGGLLKQAVLSLSHSLNLRNQMTLAGETAWPSPRNELQAALLALDARVIRHGRDPIAMADYLALEPRDGIITSLEIPLAPKREHGFHKVSPAKGGRPLLLLTGSAQFDGEHLAELRLVLGNLGPIPCRARALETRLIGMDRAALAEAAFTKADRADLEVVEEPEASAPSKWAWADALLAEFFAPPTRDDGS
jgi:aerobic carbon-monoxide dehydrogenase medium subunit